MLNTPKRRKPAKLGMRQPPQIRCAAHLQWIRGHVCAVDIGCGFCFGKTEAAHTRVGTDGGLAVKPGDNWTIPLCHHHHAEQHSIGEPAFEKKYGIDMKKIAEALWSKSPHRRKVQP